MELDRIWLGELADEIEVSELEVGEIRVDSARIYL